MIRLFLSASVPLPERDQKYFLTADVLGIREAIKALVTTAIDEATIVFGGHPAITPLVALLLRGMRQQQKNSVIIYQSAYFEDEFAEENDEFLQFHLIKSTGDRQSSLRVMRNLMIRSQRFDAAVFIGGMEGVWEEYREFADVHPSALCFPIASTGAAAGELYREIGIGRRDLLYELTYRLFSVTF